jgi:hypothetical protein
MDIEIKVVGAYSFKSAENRKSFVNIAAGVLSAGGREFAPYPMNGALTDKEWHIDGGNDWFLIFSEDADNLVRIRHRYSDEGALQALAGWLAYRWHGQVVSAQSGIATAA